MNTSTNKLEELIELAEDKNVLLVFLRHFGCTFCRETLTDLAQVKDKIQQSGTMIVVVHMVPFSIAQRLLNLYELKGISHISDPNKELYVHYGLEKVKTGQFFNPFIWWRIFVSAILKGHLIGKPAGDTFQMPGAFFLHKKKILNKFISKKVSDMPDFLKLTNLA